MTKKSKKKHKKLHIQPLFFFTQRHHILHVASPLPDANRLRVFGFMLKIDLIIVKDALDRVLQVLSFF